MRADRIQLQQVVLNLVRNSMDALDEAKKFSAMLTAYAPKRLETWVLRYDVAKRRNKTLLALQALHRARAIDPNSAELFVRIVDFAGRERTNGLSETVRSVIDEETLPLLGGGSDADVKSFIDAASARIRNDPFTELPLRVAVANALLNENSMYGSARTVGMSCREKVSLIGSCRDDVRLLIGSCVTCVKDHKLFDTTSCMCLCFTPTKIECHLFFDVAA